MGRGGGISCPDSPLQAEGEPREQGYARAVGEQVEQIQGPTRNEMLAEFLQQDKAEHQQAAKMCRHPAKTRFPELQGGIAAEREQAKEAEMAELVAIRQHFDQIKKDAAPACVGQPDDPADEGEESGSGERNQEADEDSLAWHVFSALGKCAF